ncbi:MAG: adenylate/guanylate cyclase domain-containing protein [Spirochaeta sp.]
MVSRLRRLIGPKVGGTRVVPLLQKIIIIFVVFLVLSNFVTNYVNLVLNRGEQIRLMNQLLVKDLKDLQVFAANQAQIYDFNDDLETAVENMRTAAMRELPGEKSVSMAVHPDGEIFFLATARTDPPEEFSDRNALFEMLNEYEQRRFEGSLRFSLAGDSYFGVFRYNEQWDVFLVRAEELTEFYADSRRIFMIISGIIIGISLFSTIIGIFLLGYIFRFLGQITDSIMGMQDKQQLDMVTLDGAPNDDITYLGVAFNSLASTVDNLMNIFKKFVARDIAAKAYREREIRLEGEKRELTILFTDIRSFTSMTEILGTDIIKLLNLHYDRAIRLIHQQDGDIASIIGDALLAVFGIMGDRKLKSLQAIDAAYHMHGVAENLRNEMQKRREHIEQTRGQLTEAEIRVFKAVLLEIGVGIDGGEVFYGNIGSTERMVNTVIGDNVNSAARLEGLTRLYHVPVICSEYVRDEVESACERYHFIEIDKVQVKGKTIGKRVYWPIAVEGLGEEDWKDIHAYERALQLYYSGDWASAYDEFKRCESLPPAKVFRRRTRGQICPKEWNGIWTMKEK